MSRAVDWLVQAAHPKRLVSAEEVVSSSSESGAIKKFRTLEIDTAFGPVTEAWPVTARLLSDLPVLPPAYGPE